MYYPFKKRRRLKLESWLKELIEKIKPLDKALLSEAQNRLDNLTKPRGSLGRLEELGKLFVAIRGDLWAKVEKKAVFVFAGDHGVTEEGVSAFPKEVTAQMVYNFLRGGAGINVVSRQVGADVFVVDMGVDHFFKPADGLFNAKVRESGTSNIAVGPAMSREEALESLKNGVEVAFHYAAKGYNLFATGDMGIGNTTPSSAIFAGLTGKTPDEVTGRGTGIDNETLARKIGVVKRALEVNRPDPSDPVDVLAKVGGFEIGGIAGLILGSASLGIPVIVDGFISTAGALIAVALAPQVKEYIVCAHKSAAFGHEVALEWLGCRPLLDLDMRLGEGTGAAIGMWLMELGERILHEMATFEEAAVAEGEEV